jgi:hypothetical protein
MSRSDPSVSIPCPDQTCDGVLRLSFAALGHLIGCGEALRCPACRQDMRHQLQLQDSAVDSRLHPPVTAKRVQGA